jgi:hypothetical protein
VGMSRHGCNSMNSPSRQEMLNRLAEAAEAVSETRREGRESVLLKTMRVLGVKLGHFVEMCEVLGEGKWATKEDPYAYVAQTTRNTAQRQGRRDAKFLEIIENAQLERCALETDRASESVRSAGLGLGYRELVRRLPEEFKTVRQPSSSWKSEIDECNALSGPDASYFHVGSFASPNFGAWAQKAGLSEPEQKALNFIAAGVSRDEALRRQPDEATRKALQAGYRQLRRRGFGRLAAVIPPRTRDQGRPSSRSQATDWYSRKPGTHPYPPKSFIAGITPSRIVQASQPFDPIPWWSGPVPRKKTK